MGIGMEKRYGCAVVTGASAGLGEEFASQLGGRVGKLVLVARREERLVRLAEELGKIFPEVEVKVVVADLADADRRAHV